MMIESGLLGQLLVSGVFTISNRSNSSNVYVSYSECLLDAVSRLVIRINNDDHLIEKGDLMIEVLDSTIGMVGQSLRYEAARVVQRLSNEGKTVVNRKGIVEYRVQTGVIIDGTKFYFSVSLVNKRNDKTVVGVFETKKESEDFIKSAYPNKEVKSIIKVDSELTRRFS